MMNLTTAIAFLGVAIIFAVLGLIKIIENRQDKNRF